jgi:hypothetical protein
LLHCLPCIVHYYYHLPCIVHYYYHLPCIVHYYYHLPCIVHYYYYHLPCIVPVSRFLITSASAPSIPPESSWSCFGPPPLDAPSLLRPNMDKIWEGG